MAVINSIADREQEMKTWRHLLHQHPETSFEEIWTSDFIAEKRDTNFTYIRYENVGHVTSWNADPDNYVYQLETFLSSLD